MYCSVKNKCFTSDALRMHGLYNYLPINLVELHHMYIRLLILKSHLFSNITSFLRYSSGSNIISYKDCDTVTRSDCPQQSKKIHMPNALFTADDDIDFSATITVPNRGYSVKLSTANSKLHLTNYVIKKSYITENFR